MDHNTELLGGIYENAELARDVLGKLIRRCEDSNLRSEMADQFASYHSIMGDAASYLAAEGKKPHGMGELYRAPIHASMRLNLCIDSTSSHLAEMLMEGYLMGIIDMERNLKRYTGARERSIALGKKLLSTEESNLKRMRDFL